MGDDDYSMAIPRAYMPQGKSVEWATPPELFDALDREFGPFTCDPACTPEQYSAQVVASRGGRICIPPGYDQEPTPTCAYAHDGLIAPWRGRVFLNPPYGRGIGVWIAKAVHEVEVGHAERVVALLPVRTGTRWWQWYIFQSWRTPPIDVDAVFDRVERHDRLAVCRFLPGRLRFVGASSAAPFDSCVVVWE